VLTESYEAGPQLPEVRDITLGELLQEAAEAFPDRLAMITGMSDARARRQWTYAEMYDRARTTARAIRSRFEPGERVAVWAPNIPEWLLVEFGAAMAGVIVVTVNPSFQAKELAYVLKQSRSAGIFVLPEFHGNQMLAAVAEVRDECPELREVIRFDEFDAFMTCGEKSGTELPEVRPEDAVMIQYTSGTTGFPKGAVLHHRGLVNDAAFTMDRMGVKEGSSFLTYMPLFHTSGCALCVLGAISKKTTQVLVEMFEPGLVLELIETYRVGALLGVPTMLVAMLEHPDFSRRDLSSIKTMCSGGSTVPAHLVRRLEEDLGARFTIVFGQTECSPVSSMSSPDDSIEDKANTLGTALPNVEVKIVDPETGDTVPVDTVGEYCTRGFHIMRGYFGMDEATAEAIDADGWLHTGDLCSMDERGYCRVEGRLKDMIIRGGENIYPREIEELLFKHPSVSEVAVVGLPDELMGEVVGAFIRPAPGQTVDKDILFNYLRQYLSPQKTPKHWLSVEEFPLTGPGKIQKFVLRNQWEQGAIEEL